MAKIMSESLIKRALQQFPLKETIKAKPGQLNIIEMVTRFPKNGLGVKIYKKTWPENSYW
jgi:hypothetical protein